MTKPREWLARAKVLIRAGILCLVLVGALLYGVLERLELQALNTQFHLRGPVAPKTPIVIVSIDEDSFDELDLAWPWPRALHGKFLEILSEGKPAAIGLDIVFSEPSSRGPADDEAFARGLARAGNAVLAAALTVVKESFYTKEDLNPPLKVLRDKAAAYGIVNFAIDLDAFVRSTSLTWPHQGVDVPSFDLQLYRLGVKAGILAAPLPREPKVLINYRGAPRTFDTVPYYRIVSGEIPPEYFEGKIVLVGATSPILHDVFPTPFAPQGNMPGVEIHANMLETLFQGLTITRVPRAVVVILVLFAGVFAFWITNRIRPIRSFLVLTVVGTAAALVTFAVLVFGRLWVDEVPVQLAMMLGYGITVVENFIKEQREKRRLSRFFSPAVLREVVRHRDELALGSSRRRITVLFSDIRGFTSISEKLTPEEVAELLREYLTRLTEAVFKHGGTVDKYIGDAVMALYNSPFEQPDHAVQAVRTALEFQEIVKELSDRWEAKCGSPLKNGVGVNTGDAVVGTLGSAQRLEYTAVGDAVNVASRLEGLTKDFATPVVISESTYEEIKDVIHARYLGEVTVKGKEIPVKIYGVDRQERRRVQRVSLETPLTITEAGVSVIAAFSDVSLTGLAAKHVPRELHKGQVVKLVLELPGLPRAISTEGRVAWASGDLAGIMFLGLSPDDEQMLEKFVENQRQAPVT